MSVLVLVEVTTKAPQQFAQLMAEIFPGTRAYDGCRGITAHVNQDDPRNVVLLEHWDSRAHHEKYFAWRTETGVVGRIVELLDGAPSIRYFDLMDA